jgi:hypothetical protein
MKLYNDGYLADCHECGVQIEEGVLFELNSFYSKKEDGDFLVCFECINKAKDIADKKYLEESNVI